MSEAEKIVGAMPRQIIAEVTQEVFTKQWLLDVIEAAKSARKVDAIRCTNCGKGIVLGEIPDLKLLIDLMKVLLEQSYGRPKEVERVDTSALVGKEIAQMTDAELFQLLSE